MMESWYTCPQGTISQKKYLMLLEKAFQVKDARKQWVPYNLSPHQKHWHSRDVAVLGDEAKSRIVVKSRNTSFTTSATISNIAAVPFYPAQVVPFVRLNITRAVDLINETKDIIKNIRPIRLPNGNLFPFNPEDVDMNASGSVKFPNGVEFRAFPANSQAAETIRGLRIAGSAGIVDESNFMRDYLNIYISLRDAAAGSIEGRKHFQMNIGTTLKGKNTPFYLWFNKIKHQDFLEIYWWHVFDPLKFNINVPILEQNLIPVVPWHDVVDLENKRLEDQDKFLEEYMCEPVADDKQFYPDTYIINAQNPNLVNMVIPVGAGLFYIGIDVASVNDYFVITIFEKVGDRYIQRYLYYDNKNVDLTDMQETCDKIIGMWKPRKVRIDGNGIGFQLAQYLRKKYGNITEPVKHKYMKTTNTEKISTNEWIHTNQKTLLSYGKIELIPDELQVIHYSQWNFNYKAESTDQWGHGDIAIANAYALMPDNFKILQHGSPIGNFIKREKMMEALKDKVIPEVAW